MNEGLRSAAAHLARAYTMYAPVSAGKRAIIAGEGLFEPLHRMTGTHVVASHVGPRFAVRFPDMIQRALFFCGVWEPTITAWMRQRLRRDDVFIDVGGNIGYHSCLAASCVGPGGRVVAMEPSPSIGALFMGNVELNGFDNVTLERCAVSDHEGTLQVMRGPDGSLGTTHTSDRPSDEAEASVPARRLQDIVAHDLLFGARMIKIDVEGAEAQVIRGVIPVLDQFQRDTEWIIELTPGGGEEATASVRALLDPFAQVGYRAFAIDNRYDANWYARNARHLANARPESLLRELPADFRNIEQLDVILTRDPALVDGAFAPPVSESPA